MNETQKKEYTAPQLEINFVGMEESIAAGSANIVPTDLNQQVYEQWDTKPEVTEEIIW
ncbi:hypothetical protein [Elizabethkingia meningoseptica]|uniref:hypothetical protein n=1 Tax=Elizabethkingia meningoseptica TaxID=238 RepID=UPI00036D01D2|nr:hypothetical protein [Elizabethkingia meningoseptica]MDE5489501.1 hypothetical protein [Elizabethkingia meningoseptica]SQG05694.1 Uncharacterised protein [Elizabethkingia meningoseptica]